jgi:ribonuclease I
MIYTYYYLALQNWCSTDYQIHGLWADINATAYPSFCLDIPFNLTSLQMTDTYDKIMDIWTDCNYNDTITLYEHEWLKHGTCISLETGITQNEYFEKAVSLYQSYHTTGGEALCFDLDFAPIDCYTLL